MYRAIVFRYIAEFIIYFAITIPRKSMKKINDLDIHTYIYRYTYMYVVRIIYLYIL